MPPFFSGCPPFRLTLRSCMNKLSKPTLLPAINHHRRGEQSSSPTTLFCRRFPREGVAILSGGGAQMVGQVRAGRNTFFGKKSRHLPTKGAVMNGGGRGGSAWSAFSGFYKKIRVETRMRCSEKCRCGGIHWEKHANKYHVCIQESKESKELQIISFKITTYNTQ